MIRIELAAGELRCLEGVFRATGDRRLRDRLQMVLMAHRQRTIAEIATDLVVHPRTVTRCLRAYQQGGLDALRSRQPPGGQPHIPDQLATEIRQWVIDGPAKQELEIANWTYADLAEHLQRTHGIATSRSAMHRFCRKIGIRPYRPTYRYLRGDPDKQAKFCQEVAELREQARQQQLVLLNQDEARIQMVPTLSTTLGVKGHRPVVGTRDCKDVLYVFGVVNQIDGAVRTTLVESRQREKRKSGQSKTTRMQQAFADHLRQIGQWYPKEKYPRVVVIIDNAPWHRGEAIKRSLAENPHLEFKRVPSYSPQLNVIERLWKGLRRRATHNRLFDTLAELKEAVQTGLRYFQTAPKRVLHLFFGRPKKVAA
jgi:transposase